MTNAAQQLKSLIGQPVDFRGVQLRMRLIPLEIWLNNGRLPTRYRRDYLRGLGGAIEMSEPLQEDEAIKESEEFIKFKEDVVRYALVEPEIAPADAQPKKTQVTLEDVQQIPDLYNFIFAYATLGGNARVPTRDGGIEAEALSTFREESGQPDDSGGDGADIRAETEPDAGDPQ